MKKLAILFILCSLSSTILFSQSNTDCEIITTISDKATKPIKMGIVISTNDAETVWNSLRLADCHFMKTRIRPQFQLTS
jgi:hypothetical protein